MKPTFNEKLIAYLTLLSGLSLSAVAVYYSVIGLTAIFAAAVVPIIVMGVVLEISKLIATLWLKQNWLTSPRTIKVYLILAIGVLMLITSMGIFGFLSKAHSDQSLISGDVISKIAVYDEKIKIAKENIDANRKALKQLDEAVDQIMARSTTETGADKAVQIRRQQSKERARLIQEIQTEQKKISDINEERAPIAAELRKVEAEVGPLKYIAAFVYGETDQTILEKSVTWVIIIIVLVFDPLAVVLLLASQHSFHYFRTVKNKTDDEPKNQEVVDQSLTMNQMVEIEDTIQSKKDDFNLKDYPYLNTGFKYPENWQHEKPQVFKDSNTENTEQNIEPNNLEEVTNNIDDQNDDLNTELQDRKRKEELINYWAELVRTKKKLMKDIPRHILLEVRARV